MGNITKSQVAKFFLAFLFLLFIGLYFTASNGYYETEERRKTTLTEEQIDKFEEDVKNCKQIDIEDYLKLNEKNYDNKISTIALNLSKEISKTFGKGLDYIFSSMAKAVNEK